MKKRETAIKHLEMALGMLDRIDGTSIYKVQQGVTGWTDKEYDEMLCTLAILIGQIKNIPPEN